MASSGAVLADPAGAPQDCFFASVAEARHPVLKGKPLVVSHSASSVGRGEVRRLGLIQRTCTEGGIEGRGEAAAPGGQLGGPGRGEAPGPHELRAREASGSAQATGHRCALHATSGRCASTRGRPCGRARVQARSRRSGGCGANALLRCRPRNAPRRCRRATTRPGRSASTPGRASARPSASARTSWWSPTCLRSTRPSRSRCASRVLAPSDGGQSSRRRAASSVPRRDVSCGRCASQLPCRRASAEGRRCWERRTRRL